MTEDLRHIVRRYYDDVFGARNLDALEQLFAPGFVGHSAGVGDFTVDDMRRSIAREIEDMPADELILDEQLVDGDRVVSRWRYRWRHDVSLFGERPSGEWLVMDGVHIDRVACGKIVERWEIKDLWGVAQRLGASVTVPVDEAAQPG